MRSKLAFAQIRGLGVTLIPIHQSIGQLNTQGSDLSDTVDSCTAVKHVLRASDPKTIKRIEEMSGIQTYHSFTWQQDITAGGAIDPSLAVEGLLQVGEMQGPAHRSQYDPGCERRSLSQFYSLHLRKRLHAVRCKNNDHSLPLSRRLENPSGTRRNALAYFAGGTRRNTISCQFSQ